MNRFQAIDPELLQLRPGHRLLDVGCGIGRHVLEMSSSVPGRFVGIDADQYDLLRAAYWHHLMCLEGKAQGSVQFVRGDGGAMPFADGFFDRVVCTEVLEHVADDRAVLTEIVRVLRPGGMLAISVPDELAERLYWSLSSQYRNHPGGHVRIYRRSALAELLRQSGVRPVDVRFRHSLEALYWLFRIIDSKNLTREGKFMTRMGKLLEDISPYLVGVSERCDALGNYLLPKSMVLYGRKMEKGLL